MDWYGCKIYVGRKLKYAYVNKSKYNKKRWQIVYDHKEWLEKKMGS